MKSEICFEMSLWEEGGGGGKMKQYTRATLIMAGDRHEQMRIHRAPSFCVYFNFQSKKCFKKYLDSTTFFYLLKPPGVLACSNLSQKFFP